MKAKEFVKKNISIGARVIFCIGVLCGILKLIAVLSTPFADFFNRHIASVFRAIAAHITSVLPFSLAETVILCAIPVAILFFVWCIVVAAKRDTLTRQIFNLLAVIVLLGSSFVLTFGIAYDTTPLEDKMELEVTNPSAEDLYRAAADTLIELNRLERSITRGENGAAPMPYSFDDMVEKLNDAYDTLYGQYAFLSPLRTKVKRIALSKPMTYTHISGVYTFWSGEANVNINYPDYIIVYTTAHEMAHQRGVVSEDEANFIAFVVCTSSDDPFLRYAGYLEVYQNVASSLASASPELYGELAKAVPKEISGEFKAYGEFFEKYSDNIAADVAGSVNNAYIENHNQPAGIKSYGMVVDLVVSYMLYEK